MNLVRSIRNLVFGAAGLVVAQTAAALPCVADNFVGSFLSPNSSVATEEAALEGFLGFDVTFDSRLESNEVGFNIQVCPNNPTLFYIVAPNMPGYYALKFGIGGTNATHDTFFFANVVDLAELAFSSAQVQCLIGGPGCPTNTNTGRLSHYTMWNANGNQVPEPGTLALVGLALTGVALARRRPRRQ